MNKNLIPVLAFTGGPCGGKTTGIPYVAEKLANAGWTPFIVPEAATLMITGGVKPGLVSIEKLQACIMYAGFAIEEQFHFAAASLPEERKPVLLCDRGILDARAYMPPELFTELLRTYGLSLIKLREQRYHAVFHMRTAADGAEEFYTLANNPARREKSLDEARSLDEATHAAWRGHPHLVVVENRTDIGIPISFEKKLHQLTQAVFQKLGIPEPLEIEKKFKVRPIHPLAHVAAEVIEIEQFYLDPEEGYDERRFRSRSQHGAAIYLETKKRAVRPGVRVETERFITAAEYQLATSMRKKGSRVIRKLRYCFFHQGRQFELDVIEDPAEHRGMFLLEIELTHEHERFELPPWIEVEREVTDDRLFSNRRLANA